MHEHPNAFSETHQHIIEEYREVMYILVDRMNQLNAFRRCENDSGMSAYHFCLAAGDLLGRARDVYLYYCAQWEGVSNETQAEMQDEDMDRPEG